ncbi:hypothetical protein BDZ89DRAFT_1057964 [Hymenopellis radicata]|nr:hypothetical protein BDZ89DRAFT_1057964 [Hymenopellis radicata]
MVLFDSGIRRGSDIIKAIAIGAQAVLLGRHFMYGLAISGPWRRSMCWSSSMPCINPIWY